MTIAALMPTPAQVALDNSGVVMPGALLYTYEAGGTSTPLATYSDAALTAPNANPIVASAGGIFGPIYLTDAPYYVELRDSDDVLVRAQDQVAAAKCADECARAHANAIL
jgi:hypothetical protein